MRRALICLIGPQTLFFLSFHPRSWICFFFNYFIAFHIHYYMLCVLAPWLIYIAQKTQCAENTKDSQEENEWSARLTDCRRVGRGFSECVHFFHFWAFLVDDSNCISWIIIYIYFSLCRLFNFCALWRWRFDGRKKNFTPKNYYTIIIISVLIWFVKFSSGLCEIHIRFILLRAMANFNELFQGFTSKYSYFHQLFSTSFFSLLFSTCSLFSTTKDFSSLTRRTKTRFLWWEVLWSRTRLHHYEEFFCNFLPAFQADARKRTHKNLAKKNITSYTNNLKWLKLFENSLSKLR